MNDAQRSHKGSEAKRILESEVFQEAMVSLEKVYTDAWKAGKTLEAREDAYRYVQLIPKLIADLKAQLMGGQMADSRIRELEGQKKRWPL